jgi:hypothetical protein
MGGLDEVEGLTIRKADDGFFVTGGAALVGTALAADFAVAIQSANVDHFLVENALNRVFDFKLVSFAIDFENHFVVLLLEQGGFFAEANVFDDLVNIFHGRKW